MSVPELKRIVDRATPEERLFLEHYLARLRREQDPEYAEELARRHRETEAGQKVSWKRPAGPIAIPPNETPSKALRAGF